MLTPAPRRAGALAAPLLAALLALAGLLADAPAGEAGVDRWTSLGPEGGRSLALAFDPADPAVLYLAGEGGLWKSADAGGGWWRLAPDGGGPGSFVAVDPFDRRAVYSASFDGLERSLDGGVDWTVARAAPADFPYRGLAADPHVPGAVYVLSEPRGVLKSVDRGRTWEGFGNGLAGLAPFTSLAVDPTRPGALYVATARGVFASADGGGHWSAGGGGPAGAPVSGSLSAAATPGGEHGDAATLYAFVPAGAPPGLGGATLLRSTDGALSWVPVRQPAGDLAAVAFAAAPVDANRLYLLGDDGRLAASRDGGATWKLAGRLPLGFATLAADPRDPGAIYALTGAGGSYGGVFRSADGGATWRPVSRGLAATSIAALAAAPGALYALAADGTLSASGDFGATWTPLPVAVPGIALAADPVDARHLLLSTSAGGVGGLGGILASADGGVTWTSPPGAGPAGTTFLAFDPYRRGRALAGTSSGAAWASGDGGATWAPLAPFPAPPAPCPICSQSLADVAFSPADPQRLYALSGGTLYASADGGAAWTALPGAGGNLRAVVLDPSALESSDAPETLYAGGCAGLQKSVDGGATWESSGAGLPAIVAPPGGGAPLFCIDRLAIVPRHPSQPSRPATLYADAGGPLSRLYRTVDGGASWSLLADPAAGPGDALLTALAVDPADPARLYAATAGLGVLAGRFAGATPLRLGEPAGESGLPRFTLRAAWSAGSGASGGSGPAAPHALPPAAPVALAAPAAGWFSFFAGDGVELAAKLLDGSALDGHLWIFETALTSLACELTVEDRATGAVRTYLHPAGAPASTADTAALPALPAAALGLAASAAEGACELVEREVSIPVRRSRCVSIH